MAEDTRRAKGDQEATPEASPPHEDELLDMGQAIEILKTSRPTFYRWLREGRIKGMKVGRQWRFYREDVERFLRGQEPRIDLPADIGPLNTLLQERVKELGGPDVQPPEGSEVVRAAWLMGRLAVLMRASDFHIEPHKKAGEDGAEGVLRYRVDGVLHPEATFDIRLLPAIVERWVAMAACDVKEEVRPQDGRILIKLRDTGRTVDMRVSFLHAALGPSATVRVLDPDAIQPFEIARLGFTPGDQERLERAIDAPWGLVLVTGPAGCGKTTTLYSCLSRLATPDRKLMTAEDPVEVLLPGVLQAPIRPQEGVTYATSLRAFLRSAANVIMLGELRDGETAQMALSASLTGHLVLSTLHTNTAALTLTRLVAMGCDPYLVADSTRLVLGQRLVRALCTECRRPAAPNESRLALAADLARQGGVDWDALPAAFHEAVGCTRCNHTGYRGRMALAETLEMTSEIGAALRRGASDSELHALAVGQGMTTLAADGLRRAAEGLTSLDEVLRVVPGR
jgi:excisionase family DNA binding protein